MHRDNIHLQQGPLHVHERSRAGQWHIIQGCLPCARLTQSSSIAHASQSAEAVLLNCTPASVDPDHVHAYLTSSAFCDICRPCAKSTWQQGLSPEEYERKKEAVADALVARVEAHLKGLAAAAVFRETGTPRTHRRFLNREDGSYGPIPSRRPLGMLGMPFNRTAIKASSPFLTDTVAVFLLGPCSQVLKTTMN